MHMTHDTDDPGRDDRGAESEDPPRPGLSEAGHPVLRHHDAAGRRRRLPPGGGRAGPSPIAARTSTSSSASRAAGSSSARRSRIACGPGSCRCARWGSCPSKTIRVSYDLEYGSDCARDARRRRRPGRARPDRRRPARHRRHGARDGRSGQEARRHACTALAFLIELAVLNGRAKLQGENLQAVLQVLTAGRPESPVAHRCHQAGPNDRRRRDLRQTPLVNYLLLTFARVAQVDRAIAS